VEIALIDIISRFDRDKKGFVCDNNLTLRSNLDYKNRFIWDADLAD
jgi:hypothetical protein